MDLNDPRLTKYFLLGICTAGLLYVYFGTTLMPFTYRAQARELGELEEQYERLSLEVNRARQSAKHLPHLEAEYEALQLKWDEANQLLPTQKQITSLLREISFRGLTCGVQFTLFQPQRPVAGAFYTENPIEIEAEGGYHEIAAFLNELSSMTRIVNVRNLEIEQIPEREMSDEVARAHFMAVAYTLGIDPAAEVGEAGEEGVVSSGRRLAQKVKGSAPKAKAVSQGGSQE